MLNLEPPKSLFHQIVQPKQIDREQQFLNLNHQQYFYQIVDNSGEVKDPLKIDSHTTYQIVEITDDGIVRLKDTKMINFQSTFTALETIFERYFGDFWNINPNTPFGQITVNNVSKNTMGRQVGFLDWTKKTITFKASQRERMNHLDRIKAQIDAGVCTQLVDDQKYLFDRYLTDDGLNALKTLGYQISYQRLVFDKHHNVKTQTAFKKMQQSR